MPSACDTVKGLADTPTLFGVEGLVAVVTGGGTGTSIRSKNHSFDPTLLRVVFARCARYSPICAGIGLMIAKALEHNGAVVYIVGRRLQVLEEAAREHSVRASSSRTRGIMRSAAVRALPG